MYSYDIVLIVILFI